MLKISLLSLWFLFQLFVGVNCQEQKRRILHTTTYIDGKLYILNGRDPIGPAVLQSFFYLDVSVPFNTLQFDWQDLSSVNTIPPQFSAASVKGGADNNTLFLYGGQSDDKDLVFVFDPQSNTWSTPGITGDNAMRKRALTGVVDNKENMYLWAGESIVDGINIKDENNMLILDTINLVWKEGSTVGAPTSRRYYGATMLPNQQIIYMGGLDTSGPLQFDVVYLYDTINDSWSNQNTSGKMPGERSGLSAVLGLDGQRVIIFGGLGSTTSAEPALFVLNLNGFEWYLPNVTGPAPKFRADHRADVIGNYMVVSFGDGYNQSLESDILLLDISNNDEYVWTYDFVPPPKSTENVGHGSQNGKVDRKVIIIAVAGSVAGIMLLVIGGLILRKWNKKIIPSSGDDQMEKDINKEDIHDQEQNEIPQNNDQEILENVIAK